MDEDTFFDDLKAKYPLMYGDVYCGMYVDKGWHKIISALSEAIQSYIDGRKAHNEWSLKNGYEPQEEIPQVKVAQIKEKFGGLRFYYDGGDGFVSGLVTMAEYWADSTCEVCGETGKQRSGGWIKTLCDKHDAERKAKYGRSEE